MKSNFRAIFVPHWFAVWLLVTCQSVAFAAHQTDTLTPIVLNGSLPYKISLQPYDFGAAELPTLHSYAAGHHDGKWVLISGKTNGLHGFETTGPNGFLPEFQNREVWVIDPVNKQSWHRSLEGAAGGLTTPELNSLTPTNNQFYQRGERLYMTGGYGVQATLGDGTPVNGTFDRLSAIDLPGIVDWVTTGSGVAKDHIRQIASPSFRVTGGAMYEMDGRTHIVFGQDFSGNYNPNKNGTYTNQVRSFDIVDDGTTLAITNATSTTPDPNYRRRDLNVFPVIRPAGGGALDEGLLVLSGVFTPSFGAWTVPVEIDAAGTPSMDDPAHPDTFKQGFNGYHSAKLGLFSEDRGEMHEVLFGGISVQYLNPQTMQVETDNDLPFINDITSRRGRFGRQLQPTLDRRVPGDQRSRREAAAVWIQCRVLPRRRHRNLREWRDQARRVNPADDIGLHFRRTHRERPAHAERQPAGDFRGLEHHFRRGLYARTGAE